MQEKISTVQQSIKLIGKLKEKLLVGNKQEFTCKDAGKEVEIIDVQNHKIYGIRYKLHGYAVWFEENCFEYIKEVK